MKLSNRRDPKMDRVIEKREIADGVAEYEEDRDAERDSLYDSGDDWSFIDCDDDWLDDEMDYPEDYPMADHTADAHAFDDDAGLRARVENNKVVIEVPVPANMSAGRWAQIVADLTRRIVIDLIGSRTPHGHPIRDAAEMEQVECPYPPDNDIQNDSASTILETSTTELEDTGTIRERRTPHVKARN